jgi:DNA-binding CsgD family transcriptional regulator
MNDPVSEEISHKLDVLIRLVAMGLCGEKTQREKISILDMAGLTPKVIAEMLGTTPNTVSVALSGLRRERKK